MLNYRIISYIKQYSKSNT